MSDRTVHLHRVLRARPEKVYRAFLEADAMAKWLPPHGFTCKVHHLEARAGGTFRMSFHNFGTGHGHSFSGEYLELVPAAPRRPRASTPGLSPTRQSARSTTPRATFHPASKAMY